MRIGVALAHLGGEERRRARASRRRSWTLRWPVARAAATTSSPVTPAIGCLARGVDVGHDRAVGAEQRAAELLRLIARARVEVRLEDDVDARSRNTWRAAWSVAVTSVGWWA